MNTSSLNFSHSKAKLHTYLLRSVSTSTGKQSWRVYKTADHRTITPPLPHKAPTPSSYISMTHHHRTLPFPHNHAPLPLETPPLHHKNPASPSVRLVPTGLAPGPTAGSPHGATPTPQESWSLTTVLWLCYRLCGLLNLKFKQNNIHIQVEQMFYSMFRDKIW